MYMFLNYPVKLHICFDQNMLFLITEYYFFICNSVFMIYFFIYFLYLCVNLLASIACHFDTVAPEFPLCGTIKDISISISNFTFRASKGVFEHL